MIDEKCILNFSRKAQGQEKKRKCTAGNKKSVRLLCSVVEFCVFGISSNVCMFVFQPS